MRITLRDLKRGCEAFEKNESRDAMYRVALRLVDNLWPAMAEVTDGLGVLMLTWNQAFYRYGSFSFEALETTLKARQSELESYRRRNILSFDKSDEESVRDLFRAFLVALQIETQNKKRGTQSPVAVAKALHIVAPAFFPLWDREIAAAYKCGVDGREDNYLRFMRVSIDIIREVEQEYGEHRNEAGLPGASDLACSLSKLSRFPKSMLKFLDEFNYATFTKGWA